MARSRRTAPKPHTPREWLPVAAAITADANLRVAGGIARAARTAITADWELAGGEGAGGDVAELRRKRIEADSLAGRLSDLSVHIGPGSTAGTGAPAYYREADREIVLDSTVALPGVDPAGVKWTDPRWRAEHLRAAGLVEHEVGHAAHTPRRLLDEWAAAPGDVGAFARKLEESRMEASMIAAGGDAAALAGVAHELILRDFPGCSGDPFTDAMGAALILGRSEDAGGSLPADEVEPFRDAYVERHGEAWVSVLEGLLSDWNSTPDAEVPDAAGMAELLGQWRDSLGAAESPEPESGAGESGAAGDDSGEGSAGDSTGGAETGDGAGSGSGEAGDDSDDDAAGDDDDGQGGDDDDGEGSAGGGGDTEDDDAAGDAIREMLEDAAGEAGVKAAAAAAALADAEDAADDEATEAVSHGYTPGTSRHHPRHTEPVSDEARRLAVELSRHMRRLALPTVRKDRRAAALPPGRLRGRGAVQRDAQRAALMVPDAEPFNVTRKTITRTPPPVVGIMLDVSGSMRRAAAPAAATAWALAEAGRAVQARTAMVTFGDRGRLVDHSPTAVTVTNCSGGWENFREGFAILDQRLRLTSPGLGARLLVVVSDGALVGPDEGESCCRVMRSLERRGVVCLWACIGTSWYGHWGEGWTDRAGHRVEVRSPATLAAAAAPIVDGITAAMSRVQVAVR